MTRAFSAPDPAEVRVDIDVRTRHVTVSGCLDMRTAPVLVQTVSGVLSREDGDIVLNLQSVRFLDAAGMSSFVQLSRKLRPVGRRLVLEGVSRRQGHLLKVAGLQGLVPRSARDEARRAPVVAGCAPRG